jgi:hypothetical protein
MAYPQIIFVLLLYLKTELELESPIQQYNNKSDKEYEMESAQSE